MHRHHRPVGTDRSTLLASRAAEMRAVPSASERALWSALCRRQLGVQFRRQVVVGEYIADFAAPAVKLIVEVDGGWHRGRERLDARRDRALARAGWRVLRLKAGLVLGSLPAAVALSSIGRTNRSAARLPPRCSKAGFLPPGGRRSRCGRGEGPESTCGDR